MIRDFLHFSEMKNVINLKVLLLQDINIIKLSLGVSYMDNEWETKRQKIIRYLKEQEGIIELKTLLNDLEYNSKASLVKDIRSIKKTLKREGKTMKILPARCLNCGFTFKHRSRFKIPSKCPECHDERIEWPSIEIRSR